jgi:hypothetical protein
MAIWNRHSTDVREYFDNNPQALVKKQKAGFTVKLFGITIIDRSLDFRATIVAKGGKEGLGFKNGNSN